MVRFFVEQSQLAQDIIALEGDNLQHARVLRLKVGEEVLLCDGSGSEARCTVENVDSMMLRVNTVSPCGSEAKVQVRVLVSYPKADKFEHIIQKSTELGACEICAFPSARCVSRPDEKSIEKKLMRWQKIAYSASEQSGRGVVPKVTALKSYQEALTLASEADLTILLYENEHAQTLQSTLKNSSWHSVSIITGPEGGLEEKEVEQARRQGINICTLGNRILRCETAPLCALSAIMYEAGEF